MSFRSTLRNIAIALITACPAFASHAAYPDKPVRFLVGYAPGGSTDIIARILAPALSARWGQPVVVENKPGASGMLAGEQTVRAAPDGYTLLLGYTPEVSINKLVFRSMRYDPIADLTPVALVAVAPLVLVAGPKFPVGSFQELMARRAPGVQPSYGSPGIGGQQHMAGELFGKLIDWPAVHVPYRGTSLAVTDLLGGQIDLFFATTPPLLPHIRAQKLRPLLVAGDKREKLLPEVPTALELGLPQLQLTNWFGVFAPKAIPASMANKISADVAKALTDPKIVKALEDQGLTPRPLQEDAFRRFIEEEMVKYKRIVEETGIRAD